VGRPPVLGTGRGGWGSRPGGGRMGSRKTGYSTGATGNGGHRGGLGPSPGEEMADRIRTARAAMGLGRALRAGRPTGIRPPRTWTVAPVTGRRRGWKSATRSGTTSARW
jgi:hypothetical protein